MKQVYIVFKRYDYEGADVLSIHSSEERAMKACCSAWDAYCAKFGFCDSDPRFYVETWDVLEEE